MHPPATHFFFNSYCLVYCARRRMTSHIVHFLIIVIVIVSTIVSVLILSAFRFALLLSAAFSVTAEDNDCARNKNGDTSENSKENMRFHPIPKRSEVRQTESNISLEGLIFGIRTSKTIPNNHIKLGFEDIQVLW